MYNYGYRDYSPQVARFTTVDPIRDGNNWFSYVVNDPVNYVDLWGLSASDAQQKNTSYPEIPQTDTELIPDSDAGINWGQVGVGFVDMGLGVATMFTTGSAMSGSGGLAAPALGTTFVVGAQAFLYGIAEVGTGFMGGELPPSTDLFLEQLSFGLIETGFDKD